MALVSYVRSKKERGNGCDAPGPGPAGKSAGPLRPLRHPGSNTSEATLDQLHPAVVVSWAGRCGGTGPGGVGMCFAGSHTSGRRYSGTAAQAFSTCVRARGALTEHRI
ncbi:hypothetical protein GCM10010104_10320 [Streptomyces indiaensis]|uniref:Uncharacterized protein n=1 Tax=Streptomyces indiaensis TaxID=284033 RepID=A0ABN3D684_9ACTN